MFRTSAIVLLAGLVTVANARTESISWRDETPDKVMLGSAKPDLVHKFAWALPGVLGRDLISRLERMHAYNKGPVPAHTLKSSERIGTGGGATSLLEKGRKML